MAKQSKPNLPPVIIKPTKYRGAIPRVYHREIYELYINGSHQSDIQTIINGKYNKQYSLSSVKAVIKYIKNDHIRAIDSQFLEGVKDQATIDLKRLEEMYVKAEGVCNAIIAAGDHRNTAQILNQVTALLKLKLSLIKDARDKNQGSPEDTETDDESEEMREEIIRKLTKLKVIDGGK